MHKFKVPLRVRVTKLKWFTLNLNLFRNAHFHVLNKAKRLYKEEISEAVLSLPRLTKVRVELRLYPKTKRLCDLDNVLSIHAKFLFDALVEHCILNDDTYLTIPEIDFRFGEVDKDDPRVEVTIQEID